MKEITPEYFRASNELNMKLNELEVVAADTVLMKMILDLREDIKDLYYTLGLDPNGY